MPTWGPITVIVNDSPFYFWKLAKKTDYSQLYLWVQHTRTENILGKKIPESSKSQSLNLLQPEGFPKMTHHLHAGTGLPSGSGLNESIPDEKYF